MNQSINWVFTCNIHTRVTREITHSGLTATRTRVNLQVLALSFTSRCVNSSVYFLGCPPPTCYWSVSFSFPLLRGISTKLGGNLELNRIKRTVLRDANVTFEFFFMYPFFAVVLLRQFWIDSRGPVRNGSAYCFCRFFYYSWVHFS